ncbi:SHOCT domain-containing protein [Kitasatospora sp. NBC_01539]|uniref:SHOCT domain-containing protein n=1 Tax=Kitasatospora sp. NBC_01539 TaxID=2903577 RepID=UPI0038601649
MDVLLAHADGRWAGPGPWILLVPLFWAAVVLLVVLVLRRTAWRRGGCGRGTGPLATLGDRYARGEIDADEYRAKRTVLTERPDRADPSGGAV